MTVLTTNLDIGIAVTTLVSAGIGAYLGAYLKKKGENLATHEDIGKLLDQVRAVTTITKEIEAKIPLLLTPSRETRACRGPRFAKDGAPVFVLTDAKK